MEEYREGEMRREGCREGEREGGGRERKGEGKKQEKGGRESGKERVQEEGVGISTEGEERGGEGNGSRESRMIHTCIHMYMYSMCIHERQGTCTYISLPQASWSPPLPPPPPPHSPSRCLPLLSTHRCES